MKRQEILERIPDTREEYEELIIEVLDYFEEKFNEIAKDLTISGIEKLSQVEDAYDKAVSAGEELY